MALEHTVHSYEGQCHCGAVRFRFRSEAITEGRRCNCSICVRKGAVMSARYYQPDELEIVQGRDRLSLYRFGDNLVNHWFCGHCGVYPFHDGVGDYEGRYRVNLGCVEGVDTFDLEVKLIDGRAL
jgi:hypothetical protein